MVHILPSSYQWLIPPFDSKILDELANRGLYPTIEGILLPALGYCLFFSVARIFLSSAFFKVKLILHSFVFSFLLYLNHLCDYSYFTAVCEVRDENSQFEF